MQLVSFFQLLMADTPEAMDEATQVVDQVAVVGIWGGGERWVSPWPLERSCRC